MLASRRVPMKFDAHYASSPRPVTTEAKPRLNAEVIKQLSSGSLSGRLSLSSRKGLMLRYLHNVPGFALGLVMSLFSKVLVLFIGLGITASQFASRFLGINVLDILNLRKRVDSSKILSSLNKNPVFKLSFGLTFALAAFTSF
jgi:hypothetical protein